MLKFGSNKKKDIPVLWIVKTVWICKPEIVELHGTNGDIDNNYDIMSRHINILKKNKE
jgi:hypothetical protein